MNVILKRIGETTTVPDIEGFIEPALRGGLLKRPGRIERLRIERLQQPGSSHVEYDAVVRIESDAVAQRVIKTLNRKRCNGKLIDVCEYHLRHREDDRRIGRYRPLKGNRLEDRRVGDRRRWNLEITDITEERKKPKIVYRLPYLLGSHRG